MSESHSNGAKAQAFETWDARRLMKRINSSTQSRIRTIGEKVKAIGERVGKTYELVALDPTSVLFEDKGTNTYFTADIAKSGKRFSIDNVRQIRVVEESKGEDFDKGIVEFVESVRCGDSKGADRLWSLLSAHKFSPKTVPSNGLVRTRDGSVRRISVFEAVIPEERSKRIVGALKKALSDEVNITEGRVVNASFLDEDEKKIVIPINDWTRARLRAHYMKGIAEDAYKSKPFASLVHDAAALVSEGKLREAATLTRPFFTKEQEFCMLRKPEFTRLIENALAARGEFNPFIARDTARLLHALNLKYNRGSITEVWKRVAQGAQVTAIYEDASELETAETDQEFEAGYEGFLDGVMNESDDVLASRAKVYRMCLQILQSVLSNIETEEEQADALNQMAEALSTNPDHATVMQAEQLLAEIADEIIEAVANLESFDDEKTEVDDEEPELPEGDLEEIPDLEGGEEPEGLPSGLGGPGGPPEGPGGPGGPPEGPGGPPEEEEEEAPLPFESKDPRKMTISERRAFALKKYGYVFVEDLTAEELSVEAEGWELKGNLYVTEDGLETSVKNLDRLMARCDKVGPAARSVHSRLGTIRENLLVHGEIMGRHDPYAATLRQRDAAQAAHLKVNAEYRGYVTEGPDGIDDPKGQGVQPKGTTEVDGSGGAGAKAAPKSGKVAEGGARMTDKRGGKGVATKEAKAEEGLDPDNKLTGRSMKEVHYGEGVAESLEEAIRALEEEADALAAPKGKGLASHPTDSDGRRAGNSPNKGAVDAEEGGLPVRRADGKGVQKKGAHDSDGRKASNGPAGGGGPAKQEEENVPLRRAKGEGVPKKGATDSDGRKAGNYFGESKCQCCEDCPECECDGCLCGDQGLEEAQHNWPTRAAVQHQGGKRKNPLAPKRYHEDSHEGGGENPRESTLSDEDRAIEEEVFRMFRDMHEEVKVSVTGADLAGNEESYTATSADADLSAVVAGVMDVMKGRDEVEDDILDPEELDPDAVSDEIDGEIEAAMDEPMGDDLGGDGLGLGGDDLGLGGDDLGLGDDLGGDLGGGEDLPLPDLDGGEEPAPRPAGEDPLEEPEPRL